MMTVSSLRLTCVMDHGTLLTRLDHFIVHSSCLHWNAPIKSYFFPSLILDHKPISLHIQALPKYGPLPFHFNTLWCHHQDVVDLIEST
jgi:hypothetical protein